MKSCCCEIGDTTGVYEIQELNGRKVSVVVNAGNCVGDGSCHMVCKPRAMVCVPRRIQ